MIGHGNWLSSRRTTGMDGTEPWWEVESGGERMKIMERKWMAKTKRGKREQEGRPSMEHVQVIAIR